MYLTSHIINHIPKSIAKQFFDWKTRMKFTNWKTQASLWYWKKHRLEIIKAYKTLEESTSKQHISIRRKIKKTYSITYYIYYTCLRTSYLKLKSSNGGFLKLGWKIESNSHYYNNWIFYNSNNNLLKSRTVIEKKRETTFLCKIGIENS